MYHNRQTSVDRRAQRDAFIKEAAERTAEAKKSIARLEHLLVSVVDASPVFEIAKQKIVSKFNKHQPRPQTPKYSNFPREPKREDWTVKAEVTFLDQLLAFRRNAKMRVAEEKTEKDFREEHARWFAECQRIEKSNEDLHKSYQDRLQKWTNEQAEWEELCKENNKVLDNAAAGLRDGDADSVYWLFQKVWDHLLPLPVDLFSDDGYQLDFDEDAKTLVIDVDLPEFERTPNVRGFRYVAARNAIEEVLHKDHVVREMYDGFVYQLALAIPYAFFACDSECAVKAIVVNGWVTYTNRASGNKTTACIVSLHCEANELSKINMREVDAKSCFRSLKGVASPQINSLTPVRPIITIDRSDKRFVNSEDVIEGMSEGTNLAAIGWEEFEHLIRELFEKEFSVGGGEVKVTQASRDGGVDAIAFDPDPIRGGKIVIQAKRYTNTVDVSAVRDLYGTVMSEGATKGIIVTTSGFGPDAHRFAKGKPLTLLDGNNLLYLLAKHGTVARIDLAEAKKLGNPLMRSSNKA